MNAMPATADSGTMNATGNAIAATAATAISHLSWLALHVHPPGGSG